MRKAVEIRWHARAGQGAVTAAKSLADAALAEGKFIQAFPDYGPERMGAPVKAFNRISGQPIRMRGLVEHPSVVIVVDPSLLGPLVVENVTEDVVLLVNSHHTPSAVREMLQLSHGSIWTVDAFGIAHNTIGLRKPNTPMLGALARATRIVELDTLLAETEKTFGSKYSPDVVQGNLDAIRQAYHDAQSEFEPEGVGHD